MQNRRKRKKQLTEEEALNKLMKYCAYQDRCHQEVRTKLIQLEVYGDKLERIMSRLIEEDFLNEERFARSFARGKFRMKSWGKNKITLGLKRKNISPYCIRKAMTEIDDEEYANTLNSLLNKQLIKLKNKPNPRQSLIEFGIRKGYSFQDIEPILKDIYN